MIHVAFSGDGRAHAFADQPSDLHVVQPMVDPYAHSITHHHWVGGFDCHTVKFDMASLNRSSSCRTCFIEADCPHPRVDPHLLRHGLTVLTELS